MIRSLFRSGRESLSISTRLRLWSSGAQGLGLQFSTVSQSLHANVLEHLPAALNQRSNAVSTNEAVRASHGHDAGWQAPQAPQAVVFPRSTAEVQEVVRVCAAHSVPIIPYGQGTSVEGHIQAHRGGVAVSTAQMSEVVELNAADMDCRVQAGCTRKKLNDYLRDSGLFFPVDPGADASLGGMAATRASGTTAVRYGTMRDAVLGVEAVLADGQVLRTGRRVRKSSAGYDLTSLLVGSEGTLGIITEVSLRLHPVPEAIMSAVCAFKSMASAVECVQAIMACGVPLARIELLDAKAITAVNKYSGTSVEPAPTLFFEFHGSPKGVQEQAESVASIAGDCGGSAFQYSSAPEERDKLWAARHSAYWAACALRPGCRGFPTDVCLPISRLAESILHAQELAEKEKVLAPMVGHVGDGNYHMMLILDPSNPEEVAAAKRVSSAIVEHAQALGGTCTGEHGVGTGKLHYLEAEHGAAGLALMHSIKQAFDPKGILNPGKLGSKILS